MSISAAEWIARSTIDPEIFERWPDYRLVMVATDHVEASGLVEVAGRLHASAHEVARAESAEPDGHTVRWHDAYRDFGVKPRVARPSVDALVRRAASDNGVPRINVLFDLYNAISILHRVPIGGEDLDRYDGPARLLCATGVESFHTSVDGAPVVDHAVVGEPVWVDDAGITCRRWNWRQTSRTAIHAGTTSVGFIIDSLDAPAHRGAALAAEQLAELLPGSHLRTIDISSR